MTHFDKWWFGKAINRAERRGRRQAEERIIKLLEAYFELTKFSQAEEKAPPNDDWDAGFNASLALIKGDQK